MQFKYANFKQIYLLERHNTEWSSKQRDLGVAVAANPNICATKIRPLRLTYTDRT
jgi:hypothetical protein